MRDRLDLAHRLVFLLLGIPLLASMVAAGPSTLYFHVADPANMDDIPLNAVEPPANFTFRHGGGPTAATFTCTGPTGGPGSQSHTVHAIAYAGLTDDTATAQGLRGEWRGLAYGTRLQGNLTLHWYIEASSQVAPGGDPGTVPIPLANVVVRMAMREGEDVGAGPAGYDQGLLIAQGQSAPAHLAGPQTQGASYDLVDGRYVYNITVPVAIVAADLKEAGFNVRVDVFTDNPACGTTGGQAMAPLVVIHNSPGHRPSLDLQVETPLKVLETNVTESKAGVVHLRATLLPVWGAYALGDATVEASGPGPVANTTTQMVMPRAEDPSVRPHSPAYFFWHWDARQAKGVAGEYALELTATDASGNAQQATGITFRLAEDEHHPPPPETKASPAVAGLLLVVLVGLGCALRRHRS